MNEDDFIALGLYDPQAPGAEDRLRLLQYVVALGATQDDLLQPGRRERLGDLVLELSLRPPGEPVSFDAAVGEIGVDAAIAGRLWRALGFPDPVSTSPRLAADEVDALRLIAAVADDLLGPAATLGLARVVGSATASLAEAVVDAFRTQFEIPQRAAGAAYPDVVVRYREVATELLPPFLTAVGAIFRRHLIAVAYGSWTPDEEGGTAGRELVLGFADLVGYTALSRTLSPGSLATLVARFEEVVGDVVSHSGGRLVKLIGDGAMFVAADEADSCHIAMQLVSRVGADESLPPLRVALAKGRVVAMNGDYYGDVVNRASRMVALAEHDAVVVDGALRDRAPTGYEFEALPPTLLKGFDEPIAAYRMRRLSR
jgi:class 3 adenylate cyclase